MIIFLRLFSLDHYLKHSACITSAVSAEGPVWFSGRVVADAQVAFAS